MDSSRIYYSADLDRQFAEKIRSLFFDHLLCVGQWQVQIVEAEIYHYSHSFPDAFCHRHPDQQKQNHWYFHQKGKSFRGGTFKGVDISFGEKGSHSGILIRAIQLLNGDRLPAERIEGPSLVVDFLLNASGFEKVQDLARVCTYPTDDSTNAVYLKRQKMNPISIYRSCRVGLILDKDKFASMWPFLYLPLRYILYPEKLLKRRDTMILWLLMQGYSTAEIAPLFSGHRQERNYLNNPSPEMKNQRSSVQFIRKVQEQFNLGYRQNSIDFLWESFSKNRHELRMYRQLGGFWFKQFSEMKHLPNLFNSVARDLPSNICDA